MDTAYSICVDDLADLGSEKIPRDFQTQAHLIYNSPAALAFNSPGAQGFGVKRAGLAIPGSVMILIGPGCCGRNTTILSSEGGYSDRFFFYVLDESDIVTGRHLRKIPQAVEEVIQSLSKEPTVVMLCLTCVDALLGTDMERVCRKAQERVGLPVVPCYMYALTREGRRPPMVAVRQAVYSLLQPQPRHRREANILGFFAPLQDDCELYDILHQLGIRTVREISRAQSMEEYYAMSRANFNIVLHPESRLAARDMEERLHIPNIEVVRLYEIDRIERQYQALANVLGGAIDDGVWKKETQRVVDTVSKVYRGCHVAIGEMMNGNAFELALALDKAGFIIDEIFSNVNAQDFPWIRYLQKLSPQTKVYSNLSPSMLYYREPETPLHLTISKDAAWYHPRAAHVYWDDDIQPFGYAGVRSLFRAIENALKGRPL